MRQKYASCATCNKTLRVLRYALLKMYDSIIIGAGPAGLTAAIYLARKKVKTLVISKDLGGQTLETATIENYLGFQVIAGHELVKKFEEHLKLFEDLEIKEGEEASEIKKIPRGFEIKTSKGKYQSRAIILATGKLPRRLNVPGEREFQGRGLTYCATCDAPLFFNKKVAVIGGGNSGLEAVLQLDKIAKKIYLIEIKEKLLADEVLQEQARKSKKVEILLKTKIKEISGDQFVKKIKVETNGKEYALEIEGVFVEIGLYPASTLVKDLVKLNSWKEVIIDKENMTSESGIFAAGDVTDVPDKQIIIAAGEGSKAALSCYKYLTRAK